MNATQVTWYLARRLDNGSFSCGESWMDDIADARLYRRIGPAKSAVTKWVKDNPGKPIPQILEWKLDIASATLVDVAGETQKRISRAAKQKITREEADRLDRLDYLARREREIMEEKARLTK